MNKLSIDTDNYYLTVDNNQDYFLEINEKNTNIKIEILENIKSNIGLFIKNSHVNLSISLYKNSHLEINQLMINASSDTLVNQKENSNLNYVNSVLTRNDSSNHIKIKQEEKNCYAILDLNGINLENEKLHYIIDGVITKEAINTTLSENSQIINFKKGNSKIMPNLLVDNSEVSASHSAYIGTFSNEELFYLNSRGLTNQMARELLLKSVLLKKMNMKYKDEFLNSIKEEMNEK